MSLWNVIHILAVPTGAPQLFKAEAVSSSSIRITWIPPPEEEQNGVIRSYHINVTTEDDGTSTTMHFETDGFTTIFILNALHPFYVYHIEIAAYTIGLGPTASAVERTDPDGQSCNTVSYHTHAYNMLLLFHKVPSGAPQNLTVVALNSRSVQASWTEPEADHHNGLIVDYILLLSGLDSDEVYELQSDGNTFVKTLSSLHPFYTYTLSIAAVTIDIGPFSSAVVFQMPEDGK